MLSGEEFQFVNFRSLLHVRLVSRMALSKANWPEIEEIGSGRRPQVIESSLPPQFVKDLEEAFKVFDLNGDGRISKAELGKVLRSIGDVMTDAELEQMIRDADTDGDGEVDLQEFINLNTDTTDIGRATLGMDLGGELVTSSLAEALQSAFNVFDSDRDGFISASELQRVLSSLGDDKISHDDCRRMISCVDIDGDGLVNFKEFQILMTGHLA